MCPFQDLLRTGLRQRAGELIGCLFHRLSNPGQTQGQRGRGAMRPMVAYYRANTIEQQQDGLRLEAQRNAVRRFAEAEGFIIVAEISEVEMDEVDEALNKRAMLAAALAVARHYGRDCPVCVSTVDRLTRDSSLIPGLMAEGVPFVVVTLAEKMRTRTK